MGKKERSVFTWLVPLLGIIFLLLVTLKRVPEQHECDDGDIYDSLMKNYVKKDIDEEGCDETSPVYKEIKGIDINALFLYSLSLDNKDNIYVTVDKKLLILDPGGSELKNIKLSAPGRALALAENSDIYIGFKKNIAVYDSAGKEKSTWEKIDKESMITSLTISGNSLFIADAGTSSVWKFDLEGKRLGKIGVENRKKGIPRFVVPSPYFDLATAPDGSIWIVNPGFHKLENFALDGSLKRMWGDLSSGIGGFSGCCNPTNIALLKDGSFVTSEKGDIRVKLYNPKGNFNALVAGESQFRKGTKGLDLAVDSKNRIFVLDPKMKKIRIFVKK